MLLQKGADLLCAGCLALGMRVLGCWIATPPVGTSLHKHICRSTPLQWGWEFWGAVLPPSLLGLPCTNAYAGQHHRNGGGSARVLDHHPCWGYPAQTHLQVNITVIGVRVIGCWIAPTPVGARLHKHICRSTSP